MPSFLCSLLHTYVYSPFFAGYDAQHPRANIFLLTIEESRLATVSTTSPKAKVPGMRCLLVVKGMQQSILVVFPSSRERAISTHHREARPCGCSLSFELLVPAYDTYMRQLAVVNKSTSLTQWLNYASLFLLPWERSSCAQFCWKTKRLHGWCRRPLSCERHNNDWRH